MTTPDTNLIHQATTLTRQGNLAGATTLIQQALGSTSTARAVPPAGARGPTGQSGCWRAAQGSPARPPAAIDTGRVIDGEVAGRPEPETVGNVGAAPQTTQYDCSVDARFAYAGSSLDYQLYTPPAHDEPAPLLVMLHGCTQDAADFARGTAMNALARDAGYYVLYPSQDSQANLNGCWNWFNPTHQHRGSGEPAVLSALTREIAGSRAIDCRRIFIAGLSAGGAMAVIMGQQYPELFAGVGVHSGLPAGAARNLPEALSAMQGRTPGALHQAPLPAAYTDTRFTDTRFTMRRFSPLTGHTTPSKPAPRPQNSDAAPPTIVLHGTEDRTVDPGNAQRIVDACVPPGLAAHSRPDTDEGTLAGRSYRCHVYRDANQQVVCEYWELMGAGHSWSGGDTSGSHTDPSGPCASGEMLRFFNQCAPLKVETPGPRVA